MNILSEFWIILLEVIYLPIYNFFGYDGFLTFVTLVLFVATQFWIFWHLFLKPYIYIIKFFINFVNRNFLFKEVEAGEKNS